MKTVIACDSFKGSLSAREVCRSLENGIKSVCPDVSVQSFPLADGGEGTVESFYGICGGRLVKAQTVNCFFEPITAEYLLLNEHTAVIETAAASGITNVPTERLNPMTASTFGTGLLIKDAVANGADEIILGLGGSATNDGGTGVLNALGIDFLDGNGNVLSPTGENLIKIKDFSVREGFADYRSIKFTLACDVENVFCGKMGAAFVFARQKGADDSMITALDRGLESFASLIRDKVGIDLKTVSGAGAAGGLGGGMLALLDCEIKSGFNVLASFSDIEAAVAQADLVITGEGKTDSQTACGKLPYRVSMLARKYNKPCVLVCGQLDISADLNMLGFTAAYELTDSGVETARAIAEAGKLLTQKGRLIAKKHINKKD